MEKGFFVTFEGGEGSGKSLQTRTLYHRLEKLLIPAILIHEPGSTSLGEKLSRLLKWGRNNEISPLAELLLFNASRAQLVQEVVRPALSEGKVVICDRFMDSTLAYQGYGRGIDISIINNANRVATGGLLPDISFLLDIPVEEGLERKSTRETNRFEQEELAFHQRVRQGYLDLASADLERFVVINARLDKQIIAGIIWQQVTERLKFRKICTDK